MFVELSTGQNGQYINNNNATQNGATTLKRTTLSRMTVYQMFAEHGSK